MDNETLKRYRTEKPKDTSEKIAFEILYDLLDRQGFDGFWGDIDDWIKNEILESWVYIIKDNTNAN